MLNKQTNNLMKRKNQKIKMFYDIILYNNIHFYASFSFRSAYFGTGNLYGMKSVPTYCYNT